MKLDDLYFDWDNIWGVFLLVIVTVAVVFLTITFVKPHPVQGYYLKGDPENGLSIGVDVNWSPDEKIQLDRSVTYEGAIQMVKDLNNSLPNASK